MVEHRFVSSYGKVYSIQAVFNCGLPHRLKLANPLIGVSLVCSSLLMFFSMRAIGHFFNSTTPLRVSQDQFYLEIMWGG